MINFHVQSSHEIDSEKAHFSSPPSGPFAQHSDNIPLTASALAIVGGKSIDPVARDVC